MLCCMQGRVAEAYSCTRKAGIRRSAVRRTCEGSLSIARALPEASALALLEASRLL